ncbi:MAG: hypothetical protein CME70_13020 [Halobacteriovorax sp.]|nr:hypothetical protein [Halobacteriovorax sp.]
MDLNFLMEYKSWPRWKVLQGELIRSHLKGYKNSYRNLSYYDLVEVAVDSKNSPLLFQEESTGFSFFAVFSNRNLTRRMSIQNTWENVSASNFEGSELLATKTIMLGELVHDLKDLPQAAAIKINPIKTLSPSGDEFHLAEEFVFAPIFDQFTSKLMVTDPEEAKALLAVNPDDEERFGIEFVFYMITNKGLPLEREEREPLLQEKIKELAFMAPRIPMKRGSGTFFCVLLNLENEMEENAFIRTYKTFDPYADVLFVNSNLEIRTGDLIKVPYNGEKIDTIFLPMIEWQRNNTLESQQHY